MIHVVAPWKFDVFRTIVYPSEAWMTTIHPGILLGEAVWADSVYPWINTIAACDQFKLISRENLVVHNNL